MTPTDTLNKAREFSEGIAEWIDEQRAKGRSDEDICQHLKSATDLARHERTASGQAA